MSVLIAIVLVIAAASGTVVVLTRDPKRQVFMLSANGFVLAILFLVLQAPDVAISEIGVEAVIVPLLFLVALTAIGNDKARRGE